MRQVRIATLSLVLLSGMLIFGGRGLILVSAATMPGASIPVSRPEVTAQTAFLPAGVAAVSRAAAQASLHAEGPAADCGCACARQHHHEKSRHEQDGSKTDRSDRNTNSDRSESGSEGTANQNDQSNENRQSSEEKGTIAKVVVEHLLG